VSDVGHWIDELFDTIDRKDAAGFAAFLTPEGVFRFGNYRPVHGRSAIINTVADFFAALHGLQHHIQDRWLMQDAAIVTGTVTYTRHDESTLEVPFADVMKLNADGIREYLVFVDNSALFAGQGA
jgi:ketosteroid isomerase-like protein